MRPISQPKDQTARVVTEIPGPKSREIRAREDEHLASGMQHFALAAGIVVDSASGSAVTDVDGNQFLDIIGGIGVNGLGHSHPVFVQSLARQAEKASVGSFTSPARARLLGKLSEHRPAPDIHRTQLYSSGAEAVESALRLAKSHTGKSEFVSFWGGFHGKTMGALSLMGSSFKEGLGPLVPGSHLIPYADCYRCPLGLKASECGMACVEMGRKMLKQQSTRNIAAFIVEPMQGTAGNIVPPKDFLPAVAELAKEFDALLIADEMITGFGRTGKFWGVEHSATRPDIVTLGKQFGGGFPISAVMTSDEISKAKPWSNPSGSSSSYGGNPLASAAALSAVEIIEEESLVENSRAVGAYFLEKLLPFVDRYPFVGDVRGAGLLLGMELVSDKKTKEPLKKETARRFFDESLKRGLLTMAYSPHFRIQPAMTIDRGTVDNVVAILTEAFDHIAEHGLWREG